MEIRKESLSCIKVCRFCLSHEKSLQSIYDRSKKTKKNDVSLPLKILSSVSVEVFPSDKMPIYICNRCVFFMDLCHEYKQICRQADETILQFIQSGLQLESVTWPPALSKMFRFGVKLPVETNVVKTVVEGGATVEVSSQDISDSEGGDENVYNVKIEGARNSQCIKIITNNENNNAPVIPTKESEFTSVSKLARHVRSHAGDRAYPCKHCDKTFVKSHHYTRHLRVKHRDMMLNDSRNVGSVEAEYRCEQCEDTFSTQDDLIYHSAIHATQNLTCPLCQERFENVDDVTTHIKSHVNGIEFMCDFCELVFTNKEKLENHLQVAHEDEIEQNPELIQNDSSMEVDMEEEDDGAINLKDEGDHMVVEITKTKDFLLPDPQVNPQESFDNTNSEESEPETTYMELSTVDTLGLVARKVPPKPIVEKVEAITVKPVSVDTVKPPLKSEALNEPASILRRAEEIKRKVNQQITTETTVEPKKDKPLKTENSSSGASDKSLRLLEKELQELKRTTRNEQIKTPAKMADLARGNRRPQLHTSTPKIRSTEDKKAKPTLFEKKLPERRAVKENKEPKDSKETKALPLNVKEKKEAKVSSPVVKDERESSESETPKSTVIKNGTADKSSDRHSDEGIRRSTRPSKIKDYAKMIRDRGRVVSDEDEDSDDDDDEYVEEEKIAEVRPKIRRTSNKPLPKVTKTPPVTVTVAKKRGRPRKNQSATPAKVKREENEEEELEKTEKESEDNISAREETFAEEKRLDESKTTEDIETADTSTSSSAEPKGAGVLMSPTGQTLKKVPIRSLPPGVRPLPLPASARPMGQGELCEMQIGKKMVKVQKIVMTKAEVEAMAKKGLLEMKDGTMVLKQGIKIPSDPVALKSTLVGEDVGKESPTKKDKATPTRCDMGE